MVSSMKVGFHTNTIQCFLTLQRFESKYNEQYNYPDIEAFAKTTIREGVLHNFSELFGLNEFDQKFSPASNRTPLEFWNFSFPKIS